MMDNLEEKALEQKLINAIRYNHLQDAKELLSKGADPNGWIQMLEEGEENVVTGPSYCYSLPPETMLIYAIKYRYYDMAKTLINARANVNQYNKEDMCPLSMAAIQEDIDFVKFIIESGADVNQVNNGNGCTPLSHAAWCGKDKAVSYLIEKGADINYQGLDGSTPLIYAVIAGNLTTVNILINAGADIHKIDQWGNNCLHIASDCRYDNTELINLFITLGPNTKNDFGNTPLYNTTWAGNLTNMRTLIKNGGDLCIINNEGKTVLDNLKKDHPNKYQEYIDDINKEKLNTEDSKQTIQTNYEYDM